MNKTHLFIVPPSMYIREPRVTKNSGLSIPISC